MKIPPSALDVLPWMIHHLAVKVLFLMVPIAALNAAITYPETRTGDMVDDYHGTSVADP